MLPAPSGRPASAARHPPHRCTVFGGEPALTPARFATDQLRGGRDEKRTATGETKTAAMKRTKPNETPKLLR